MLEFILERYNYWVVILLMMIGLYTVYSRGNLVKTVIGLNVFQTSVFIFYITIGKIAGGTAPILVGGHGGGHGDEHGGGHGEAAGHGAEAAHGAASHTEASHGKDAHGTTDLSEALKDAHGKDDQLIESLHETDDLVEGATNEGILSPNAAPADNHQSGDHHAPVDAAAEDHHGAEAGYDAAHGAADHAAEMAEVIYTNPLPHVLILTAIVVGVATTAVGLALAVRIREAYGTIEEDELEAADYEAEFGRPLPGSGAQ